jgi:hypothetical protein
MKYQDYQVDRDVREAFAVLQSTFGLVGKAKRQVLSYEMAFFRLVQGTVNAITWYGARERAIVEGHEDPLFYADSTVRQSQSSGGMKDLARVQRGSEAHKLWTVMYGYFSSLYGQLTERQPITRSRPAKAVHMASRLTFLIFLPVLLEAWMRGRLPEDDEEKGKFLAKEFFLYAARTKPIYGDLAKNFASGSAMRQNPWLESVANALESGHRMVIDDKEMSAEDWKHFIELGGYAAHIPTTAMRNGYNYLDALSEGEMDQPFWNLLRSEKDWK